MPRTPEQNKSIKAQSRKAILDAAFPLFSKHGFDKTSMATIAKEAGVSKGLIYHHFDNKVDVLIAVFDNLMEQSSEVWDVFGEDESAHDRLLKMIDISILFTKGNPEWVRLLIQLALQEDVVESLHDHISAIRSNKLQLMIPLFEELGYDDPEAEVLYIGAKFDGIALGLLSMKEDYPLEKMVNRLKSEYNLKTQ
ncbi:TetR/AcrR family transcriptional regulator [Phaeocystidibacter marisrubri]|uniref:TetR/AcrR family transcriptional regulator n=1 Tax=Phaeocystidibacter marisrubri TaxID=1577780 RepID=A0A6L3ZBP9_9FLAO|nr:TetR/AcrR family transcriptional regulator [Phaeocystidibacter marisrubri]KAB2815084.1 TetR/AcrR family transcriptional regulator [Phaeocystidibacter marisrubri]